MSLSRQQLETLYREMLRVRRVEEAIALRYAEQEMRCPTHLCIGQEAVCAGICSELTVDDYVFSNHRAHGHYLAKGGSLPGMIAELYGKSDGCCRGIGGSMHLIDPQAGFLGAVPIVASTIPLAVGAAWAAQLKGESRVAVAFFGDGAFEEGVVHESLIFATLHRLPVIFVCENNLYSVYTRIDARQPNRPIHGVAAAHGCHIATADGNDIESVCEVARNAITRTRSGGGPAFLEFSTYRWLEHCGPNYDDHLNYRPTEELPGWQERCPIRRLKDKLRSLGSESSFFSAAEAAIADEINRAFTYALDSAPPRYQDLESYVHD